MSKQVEIADLEAMGRSQLLDLWQEIFEVSAPKLLSQPFLRRFLAFELQSRRQGGLSRRVRSVLERGRPRKSSPASPAMKPGGRLLREWNGVTHVVDVSDAGFVWKGQTWRSLSAIAREITGAHWSGPRFFGLSGKAAK
ncbi:DUF2924 domain-containing protein [Ruegeria marina]|uniref:DUF2924 domain-containing protein n=1 Tax=Ruegeria marina TaxID=639004 RepID=A0A1G6VAW8_9RHOB|nr:DUF2924 domain-containing protein [Ruegeria marina]SDD50850.1 Protein of unknown function [Ruegeria marina]